MTLQWPIYNINKHPNIRISQKFAAQAVDYSQFGFIGHNGIDIAAPLGTPIYAAHDGWIVEATEKTGGYGIRVTQMFEEDGKEWLLVYGHQLDYKPLPEIGWNYWYRGHFVRQGDLIGHVDSTGFSSGHHLHFGVYEYKNGVKLNSNNGYGGGLNPQSFLPTTFPTMESKPHMELRRENGTVFIVAGVQNKVKLGIADPETLALFGDEPINDGSTAGIPQTHTISTGFVLHKHKE
jgi:hypothetical protein